MRWSAALLAILLPVAACDGPAEDPGAARVPEADSVEMAEATFDPAAFDTLSWETDQARLDRGALVYRVSCEKCHGPRGRGDGGFVSDGDTLTPPSFLAEGWTHAEDLQALRLQIHSGRGEGMPHWGLEGLSARDVDAVAAYILQVLRG